tara:strand:- start:1146 stop:2486 length:1341 start_codon:yes stop_codon:yes gene_type:complete
MKLPVLTISFILLTISTYCQEVFHDARFVKVKQFENGFITVVKGANDAELKKFHVKKYKGYYTEGIALHDKEGKFIWVRAFEDRLIFDVKVVNNKVLILNADWHNSKVNSSAELYETELDFKGKFLHEKKITYIKSDVPNSRIRGLYDDKGNIWDWITWERKENILINDLEVKGGKEDNIRITFHKNDTTYSNLITGENLRVLAHDIFSKKIGFIISGSEVHLTEKIFNTNEKILIEFETSGKLLNVKSIASQGVYIEHLELTDKNIFIGGSFQGNDTLKLEPTAYLLGKALNSPKNKFRNETARNGFVACLSEARSLDWLKIIKSEYDVSLESMSVQNGFIAIGVEYKDFVKINEKEIISLKDSSKYKYSDAALIVLDSDGTITSVNRLIGNGYEKIGAYLMDNKLILFGDFLYSMKVLDIELNDPSKNRCNYLIFKEKEVVIKK